MNTTVYPSENAMGADFSRLTLIVVTYKGNDFLRGCLASLAAVLKEPPKCVVVDNAAQESAKAICAEYRFVEYVAAPENLGFAGGNNLGLKRCTTEYVCLLNDDTTVETDPFAPLVQFLDAHPQVAVAQGKIKIENGSKSVSGKLGGAGSFLTVLGVCDSRGWLVEDGPEFAKLYPCYFASGCLFMLRRSALADAGGFLFYDHFKSYYEEVDLCHRLWLGGHEVWYVPTPALAHHNTGTSGKFPRNEILRQYYRNMWFSMLSCFGLRGLLTVVPAFFIVCMGHVVVSLSKGDARPLRNHFAAFVRVLSSIWTILRARRQIQGFRKISDTRLFKRVKVPLTWPLARKILVSRR